MSLIRIAAPQLVASPDRGEHTVSAAIDFNATPLTLWFRLQGAVADCRAESFISALLLVPVHAPTRPAGAPGPDAAAFFTGGVDSFHTALSHAGEIGALVYVPHFEAPPGSAALQTEIVARVRAVAAAMGTELLVVDANLRSAEVLRVLEPARFSPKHWNFELAHGAALAAVAHMLPRRFGRVYLAASTTYDDLFPWGSHPLLDPLWSTEARRIVHDGCAATRIAKIRRLAGSELALGALRVCAVQQRCEYNCGQCEKCFRTMIGLQIAGALERSGTFPNRLNLLRVALRPRGLPRRALGLGLSARLPAHPPTFQVWIQALKCRFSTT